MPGTRFLWSYFNTPGDLAEASLLTVLRAGQLRASADYRVERRVCPGHDILLCLRGAGWVRTRGVDHAIALGEVAWIDGAHAHAHWAEPSDPWELMWLRIDGKGLAGVSRALGVENEPVFRAGSAKAEVGRIIRRIMHALEEREPILDATLNAEVGRLLVWFFRARQSEPGGARPGDCSASTRRVINALSVYYHQRWRIEDLAECAGSSVPQLFRNFRRATGMTPMQWLRRERMLHAQRRLVETSDSVKEIAEQVGYSDCFYFSRDFKRFVGLSPTLFRVREHA
jgi:AraC family transcriptional regulator, arabinose operon regulatory protein